jgi:hypothetical protein
MDTRRLLVLTGVVCGLPLCSFACREPSELNPLRPPASGYLEAEDCRMSQFVKGWRMPDGFADPYFVNVEAGEVVSVEVKGAGSLKPCITDGAPACRPSVRFPRPGKIVFYVTALPGAEGRYIVEATVEKAPDPTFACMHFEGAIGCQITAGTFEKGASVEFEFLVRPAGATVDRAIGQPVRVLPTVPSGVYTAGETVRAGRYTIHLRVGGGRVGVPAMVTVEGSSRGAEDPPEGALFHCEIARNPDNPSGRVLLCALGAAFNVESAKVSFQANAQVAHSSASFRVGTPVEVDPNSPHAKYMVLDRLVAGVYLIELLVDGVKRGGVRVTCEPL